MRSPVTLVLLGLCSSALTLAACADAPTSSAPTAPVTSTAPPGRHPLRDPGIDRSDSWFTARIATTQEVVTPVGGATANAAPSKPAPGGPPPIAPSTIEAEVGYGSGGQLRVNVYFPKSATATGNAGIRMANNRVELLDRFGNVVSGKDFATATADVGLPSGSLLGAFLRTQVPPNAPVCAGATSTCSIPAASAVSAVATTEWRTQETVAALSAGLAPTQVERVYHRTRPDASGATAWQLVEMQEVRQRHAAGAADGIETVRATTRVTYDEYHVNVAREDARAAQAREHPENAFASAAAVAPVVAPAVAPVAAPLVAPAAFLGSAPAPFVPGPVGPMADAFQGMCPIGTVNIDQYNLVLAKPGMPKQGLSVVYQHGFCSDASVFAHVRPMLAASFSIRHEQAYSLNSTAPIDDQVTDLMARITASAVEQNVVIGTSQGGLVARRLGQRAPGLVHGVITVGTPNQGAPIASLSLQEFNAIMKYLAEQACPTEVLCAWSAAMTDAYRTGMFKIGFSESQASVAQLAPGSAFLADLNTRTESFRRVGIAFDVGRRWSLARMLGDAKSPADWVTTGKRPRGDAWVTDAEILYMTAHALQVLSLFAYWEVQSRSRGSDCDLSFNAANWPGCTPGSPAGGGLMSYWNEVLLAATLYITHYVIDTMDGIDGTWNRMTAPGGAATDGLIPTDAEMYPTTVPGAHTPQNIVVIPPTADSHMALLKSTRALRAIEEGMLAVGSP